MFRISPAAEPLAKAIRQARVFSRPTFPRFAALMIGLIVTMGRRTISHSLVAMRPLLRGHWSNYHRLYSSAKYSMWSLAAKMVFEVVKLLPKDAVIELVADDTVDGKEGKHVWAQSAHAGESPKEDPSFRRPKRAFRGFRLRRSRSPGMAANDVRSVT
jgi:DDE superfamily endonuclease